jgi:death-on-curing protein
MAPENEPDFLDLEDVMELHAEALRRHGGTDGSRDAGLLESALAQPSASFGGQWAHGDLFAMAAAYAFHIAENQPVLDGNKRTALAAAIAFLALNDIASVPDPAGRLYTAMMSIAAHSLKKEGLADLLAELVGVPRTPLPIP